ncbi:hypothetical protein GCM10007304_39560 [Rhodococcoides trifolii]|uniref:Glycosyltransferase 2-like domain-containing protein n=2 Tax=Rhodococcoides trifolii TaxID=908250 RepID=A0A917G427_9NOCA|nr:hypothetical protein GCM10007304_39560 [Rhodococcus trifolii]
MVSASQIAVEFDVTIVDDGSTDGTSEAVRTLLGDAVTVIQGDGSWYWARSMQIAESWVLDRCRGPRDCILWLNDDTYLDEGALHILFKTQSDRRDNIVVGVFTEPASDERSYGGLKRVGLHPLSYRQTAGGDEGTNLDAFNGNCVLVPVNIARKVGGIDGGFAHALADIDYGYRSRMSRIAISETPRAIGHCARGDRAVDGSMITRWKSFTGVKGGGHRKSMTRILQKTSPRMWPLIIAATYGIWWVRAITSALANPAQALTSPAKSETNT